MTLAVDVTATTEDAFPTVAPHRLSRIDAKDDLLLEWDISGDGPVRYWQERLGGLNPITGTRVQSQGVVCGMSQRCGEPTSVPLALPTPVDGSASHETDDILAGQADGDYNIEIDARDGDGWDS